MRLTGNFLASIHRCFVAAGYILLTVAPMCFFATDLLAEERPAIQVQFDFEGPVLDVFSETDRELIRSRAEQVVCELAEDSWGFLNWTEKSADEADPQAPAQTSAATWKVTLDVEIRLVDSDSGGEVPATIGTLSHAGLLGSGKHDFKQTPENETIYPIGQLIPFDDPTAVSNDIEKQLRKQLPVLLAQEKVEDFFKTIPIVERIIADADKTRVVVPVRKADLRTGEDSILRVKFTDPNDRPARLDLETSESVLEEGQYEGYVVAWITDFRLHPQPSIDTPTPWDDKLLPFLHSARDIKVYMQIYNASLTPDSVVGDGLIGDPGPGQ